MLYVLMSALYWICFYLPLPVALQPALTLLDFAPRWLVFAPLVAWLLLAVLKNAFKRWPLMLALTLVNIILVIDVKFTLFTPSVTPYNTFSIATFNAGGSRADITKMINWYQQQQLDVLLLQEARGSKIQAQLPSGLTLDCHGQLCVLTQHKLTAVRQLNREPLNGYGNYAAHYQINIANQEFSLVNVHLNTPRHGLQMLKAPRTNYQAFLRVHADMALESMIASQLITAQQDRAIIGGDFNLTQQSQIYRTYWRGWQNSFAQAGFGFGYTKKTRWLGVRIDHILLGDGFQVLSSEVHPTMGSDHNPVVVRFALR